MHTFPNDGLLSQARALLSFATPDEVAQILAPYLPPNGGRGGDLRRQFRAAELAEKREELGLPPLRLVTEAAEEPEPLNQFEVFNVSPRALGLVEYVLDPDEGDVISELERIPFELTPDDDPDDDGDTVPEPTPLAPAEAARELEYELI